MGVHPLNSTDRKTEQRKIAPPSSTPTSAHGQLLMLGQSFRGYTIKGFDHKKETLLVEREGKPAELPIKETRVKEGSDSSHADSRHASDVVLILKADGSVTSMTGEPLSPEKIQQLIRATAEAHERVHVMPILPSTSSEADRKKIFAALGPVLAAMVKQKAKISLEIVTMNASSPSAKKP